MSVQITRLAVQATAEGPSGLEGQIFFKVTLPADLDTSTGGRWGLFPGPAPLTGQAPKIYALPLPRAPHPSSPLAAASALLGLTPATAYPPSSSSSSTIDPLTPKPYVEVSQSRQVYIVVDPAASSSKPRVLRRKDSFGGLSTDGSGNLNISTKRKSDGRAPKQEWLVAVPFRAPFEDGYAEGVFAISMHVPRCLNNTLRLRISYPTLSESDEGFDVTTDPKTLMAPAGDDSLAPMRGTNHLTLRDPNEEGWEDGELPDATNRNLGFDGDDDDDGGESLQGRFPSTSTLHIAWSPALPGQSPISHAKLNSSAILPPVATVELTAATIVKLQPAVYPATPTLAFHQSLRILLSQSQQSQHELLLRSSLPEGWGWSDLNMTGKGIGDVRSLVTGEMLGRPTSAAEVPLASSDEEIEDSFATVRGSSSTKRRKAHRSQLGPSLLRQALPAADLSVDDFSFEMAASVPPTSAVSAHNGRLSQPTDLITDTDVAVSIATSTERFETTVDIKGTLCPISHLQHVIPGQPLDVPFFKATTVHGRQPCHLHLPATAKRVIDLAQADLSPTFSWPASDIQQITIHDLTLSTRSTRIGTQLVTLSGRIKSSEAQILEFGLPQASQLSILGASIDGTPIKRGVTSRWPDWDGPSGLRTSTVVGIDTEGRTGVCRLLYETTGGSSDADGRSEVALPVLRNSVSSHLTVRIEDEFIEDVETNLNQSTPPNVYAGIFSTGNPPRMSYRSSYTRTAQSPLRTLSTSQASTKHKVAPFKLFSFRTLALLAALYILASVVLEVHHLRREFTTQNHHIERYFEKQMRTLDGWEVKLHEQRAAVKEPTLGNDDSTAVGRPNSPQTFDRWLRHPAVTVTVSGVRRVLQLLKFLLTG